MYPKSRQFYYLVGWVVLVVVILLLRLLSIQILDSSYESKANNNALRYRTVYPARGEILDRNGNIIVQNSNCYNLMVIPKDVESLDTARLASVLEVSTDELISEFTKACRYSYNSPSVLFRQLEPRTKFKLDEMKLKGFYTVYRTIRHYPTNVSGNLLGYIGEVTESKTYTDPYYVSGDYIGMSGMELSYENYLRGVKGVRVEVVDAFGRSQGSYMEGKKDVPAVMGKKLTSTIDLELQEYAQRLLDGKIGSVIAIEPSTGEILVMASAPSYNPELLMGKQRSRNFASLLNDPRRPLFNRAMMSSYPPGSTFKIVNGLVALEMGVAEVSDLHPCYNGYTVGRGVKCHSHPSPINMQQAVAMSCNAYFCYVFRSILDTRKKKESIQERLQLWRDNVMSFGFGRKLDCDFVGELGGNVPSPAYYDKYYRGRWNSLSIISLSIGQGEMGVTPLQMANLAATLANRGFYYIPHVVKSIEGENIDPKFKVKNYTNVSPKYFEPLVEGMYDAVHKPGGTATAYAYPEMHLCGKTGTAQNPRGADNSVFICFAPKNNPKIAVAAYVEHGGSGATIAAPIASLIVEKYLNDTIVRPGLEEYVLNKSIDYYMYRKR